MKRIELTPQEEYARLGINSTQPTADITEEDRYRRFAVILGFPDYVDPDNYIHRIAELEAEVLKLRSELAENKTKKEVTK